MSIKSSVEFRYCERCGERVFSFERNPKLCLNCKRDDCLKEVVCD